MKAIAERLRQLAIETRMHSRTPELLATETARGDAWLRVATFLEDIADKIAAPIAMIMWCPSCGERHIDRGTFATKPHHTHACQSCGMVWRPAVVDTVGVEFLPGYKDVVS